MNLKILENKGEISSPANTGDAGYDIVAVNEPRVVGSVYQGRYYTAISHIEYDTELVIEPELNMAKMNFDFFTLVYPRSSIIKTNLSLANSVGVIDSGYRGNIIICFKYIIQPEDMKIVEGKSPKGNSAKGIVSSINPQRVYHKGDKIAQLIPCRHHDLSVSYTDKVSDSSRGSGGFGSTDL
jgi:dUTP pyrophosphatase